MKIGDKYYRYIREDNKEPTLEILRVVGFKNEEDIKVTQSINNGKFIGPYNIKATGILHNREYRLLIPDGYITLLIVKITDTIDDVIVSLHRYKDIEENNKALPYCVCRQCITDLFASQIKVNNTQYYGISISQETCPVDVEFPIVLGCDGIRDMKQYSVYKDDRLEDILSMIDNKKYDKILFYNFCDHVKSKVKEKFAYTQIVNGDKKSYDGFCKDLKTLLIENNFKYDFCRAFNILPINCDLKQYKLSDNVRLTDDIKNNLSIILCINITDTIVIPYDSTIKLDEIKQDYILVSDVNEDLYIIGYLHQGTYNISPEFIAQDTDINKIVKSVQNKKINSSIEAYEQSVRSAYNMINYSCDKYM